MKLFKETSVNNSDVDYWLMPFAVDPDYYSADEAAYITGEKLPSDKRDDNRRLFRGNALPFFLKAHSTQEGYLFASYKRGGRCIDVRLSGHLHAIRMRCAVLLPTESFDYEKSALREMYKKVDELPDMTLEQLREQLRHLPCCVMDARKETLPDYRRCDGALTTVGEEPKGTGKPVNLGTAHRRLKAVFVPGLGWDCIADWLEKQDSISAHLQRFGYDMVTLDIDGLSSSARNAQLIRNTILALPEEETRPDLVWVGYTSDFYQSDRTSTV